MTDPLPVTAAIATLDRPDRLARCLDALLAGPCQPGEIIVVDQSRTDDTRAVVEARQSRATPIIYVRQERRGLSASRNAALTRATGAVVAMTDDDCVPDRDWIAAITRAFAASPALAAVSGRVLPLGPATPGLHAVSSRERTTPAEHRSRTLPWLAGSGGNFAVRRWCVERIGRFDERLGAGSPGKAAEDMDFIHRVLSANLCIRYEPSVVIYHERQPASQRRASRWTYGFGMGAFCGKWIRRGDGYALSVMLAWSRRRQRDLRRALLARRWSQADEQWRMMRGAVAGLWHGLRLGGEDQP